MSRLWTIVASIMLFALLAACTQTAPVAQPVQKANPTAVVAASTLAPTTAAKSTDLTYDQALAKVKQVLPATKYVSLDYLPKQTPTDPMSPRTTKKQKIRVGLGWINNDEFGMFHVSIDKGFFADEGLEVELVSGGPNVDHLATLAAGTVDIGMRADGQAIPKAVSSTTPVAVTAVATLFKKQPAVFLTTTPELVFEKDGKTKRTLTPADFKGRVHVQKDAEVYPWMILDKAGLPRDQVKITGNAGFAPDVLMTKPPVAEWYLGWVVNQPRALEAAGLPWNALVYADVGYLEYADVLIVRNQTLQTDEGQDMVRRFLWALTRGTQYMLDHPEEAAKITVKHVGAEQKLTEEQVLWRFKKQMEYKLITGDDPSKLLYMNLTAWDQLVASLLQYKLVELR